MKYTKRYFLSTRKRKEKMSVDKYLGHYPDLKNKIESVTIEPARLGRDGFGSIIVEYKDSIPNYMLMYDAKEYPNGRY